jgi:hypothetical protein
VLNSCRARQVMSSGAPSSRHFLRDHFCFQRLCMGRLEMVMMVVDRFTAFAWMAALDVPGVAAMQSSTQGPPTYEHSSTREHAEPSQ